MFSGFRRGWQPANGLGCEHSAERGIESRKAGHPLLIVKRQFGWAKCRYCGIAKNASALTVLFALDNLISASFKMCFLPILTGNYTLIAYNTDSEREAEMIKLEKHAESAELAHVTAEDRIGSILTEGIRASEYGDLEVDGNGGYGVYAVRDIARHASLLRELGACGDRLRAVRFEAPGEWYECVAETVPEDYDDDPDTFAPYHLGYVVLPYDVAPEHIRGVDAI